MIATTLKRQITLKRVVIIAYVMSVLLIAGLSQASDIPAGPVTNVEVDNEQQLVRVEGMKNNSCHRVPKPKILKIDRIARKITMNVVSGGAANQFCTQVIEGKYGLVVSIASFKLPPNVRYQLSFVNAIETVRPVTVEYNGMVEGFPFSSVDMNGILIREQDGFLLRTRSQSFKVAPSHLNLEDHEGNVVDVAGHKINFGLFPVEGELTQVNETGELPQALILTGISSSNR